MGQVCGNARCIDDIKETELIDAEFLTQGSSMIQMKFTSETKGLIFRRSDNGWPIPPLMQSNNAEKIERDAYQQHRERQP